MRVPVSAEHPSFDYTTKIGFWRWLTSSAADRKEWARRRNAAAKTAQGNQQQRAEDHNARRQAELKGRRVELDARADEIKAEIKRQWKER